MGLENFAPLIGRWAVSGEAEGAIGYRWAEGGRFLFQDFRIGGARPRRRSVREIDLHRHVAGELILRQ